MAITDTYTIHTIKRNGHTEIHGTVLINGNFTGSYSEAVKAFTAAIQQYEESSGATYYKENTNMRVVVVSRSQIFFCKFKPAWEILMKREMRRK